jgi:hypothetical protein
MGHIYKDKYMVQDFMRLLKGNKMMSVHAMVLKLEACISVVNQDQAFEARFFKWKANCAWSKVELKVDWISDEEINRDV